MAEWEIFYPRVEVRQVQFNVYVPKERREILTKLEALARETGKAKNDLVFEALERYLADSRRSSGLRLQRFAMGEAEDQLTRKSIYEEQLDDRY